MSHFLAIVHVLAAVIWVGAMFFAHWILRPAALPLEMPVRVKLWSRVLGRFFPVVWSLVILLPITGYGMIFHFFGGLESLAPHVWIMQGIAWTMIVLFLVVYFGPYQGMRRMLKKLLIPEAGLYMERIRRVMGVNLTLGLIVVAVAVSGRY